jgi:hypothetical protein
MRGRVDDRFVRCHFLPYAQREHAPAGALVFDVSSYAELPYRTLSPFYVHGGIPVPGMPGTTSDTVEGIWQGLKVIRGAIAPRLFRGPGRKRGGKKPAGHRFGDQRLGIVEARYRIYRAAYQWVLENRIDPALIGRFVENALRGIPQYFHDTGDNGDINDPDAPLAHASLVAQHINRLCSPGVDP